MFLNSRLTPPAAKSAPDFETALKKRLKEGWTVVSDGPTGIQLIGPRKMRLHDKIALVAGGASLLFIAPVGIILLVAVAVDYWLITSRPKEFLMRPPPDERAPAKN